MKFHLLRIVRSIIKAPIASYSAPAGLPGANPSSSRRRGWSLTSKVGRPAAYPRRAYATRSWDRSGGQKWQWGSNGKLRMKTLEMTECDTRLIVVVPPGMSPIPETNRQCWNAMAPMMGGRSRFKKLFEGHRA